jgi:hypothetical protein
MAHPFWPLNQIDLRCPYLRKHKCFLQLREGINIDQAQRVADYLNEQVTVVGITLFENHPMFNAKSKKR